MSDYLTFYNITTTDNCSKLQFDFEINTEDATTVPSIDEATITIQNLTTEVDYDQIESISDLTSCSGEFNLLSQDTTYSKFRVIIPIGCLKIDGAAITNESFPDGLYCISWTSTISYTNGDSETVEINLTESKKYLSLCTVCCKVKQLSSDVDVDCRCCTDECNKKILNFIQAHALLKALQYSGACANITEVNENLENLQNYLNTINCNNC